MKQFALSSASGKRLIARGLDSHSAIQSALKSGTIAIIDAIRPLMGANAELIAAGGVGGAEGSVRLALWGTNGQVEAAGKLLITVSSEPRLMGIFN
jgi:hypothetical protein